jgi:hypothetical protein
MGTLFDQPPREFFSVQNNDVKCELEFVIELSKNIKYRQQILLLLWVF